jgi:hypothetical protein
MFLPTAGSKFNMAVLFFVCRRSVGTEARLKNIILLVCSLLGDVGNFLPKAIEHLSRNSSLLALIGVLVALLTLREMAKQRRESYKPRLIFQNKNFFLQKNSNGTPCFLKENANAIRKLYEPLFFLELKNIGLGSAHNIVVRWKYDQTKMIRRLSQYAQKTQLVRVNPDNHFEFLFDKESQKGYGFFINNSDEERTRMAFLCSNDSIKVKIPETLHNYITFIPYLELVAQGNPRRVDVKPDEIRVVFEYFDIGGKKQVQRLRMAIEEYAYPEEDHNKNYGVGSVSFSTR